MKKFLSALLLVIMIVSAFAALAEPSKVYTTGSVNLRKSASVDSKVLAVLKTGTECTVLDSKTDKRDVKWYNVKANGKTGWVSSVYAAESKDEDTVQGYMKTTAKLNYRKVANGKPILGTIPKGTKVAWFQTKTVNGQKWYLVRYNDKIGWAYGKYLKDVSGKNTPSYIIVGKSGNSYIRDDAKLTGKALDILHKGEQAEYLNESKKDSRGVAWYKVNFEGTTGWVSSTYTEKKAK